MTVGAPDFVVHLPHVRYELDETPQPTVVVKPAVFVGPFGVPYPQVNPPPIRMLL